MVAIESWDDMAGRVLGLLHLRGRRADLFRRALIILLLLLIARSAAKLTWALVETVLPAPENALPQVQAGRHQAPAAATGRELGEEIARLHLFGQAAPGAGGPENVPVDVPPTTLNLVLKGVVAVTPMERAMAIICEKGQQDAVYGVGDELPGRAVVKAIHADRVILERAGKLETLFLEALAASGQAPPPATANHRQLNRSFVEQKLANVADLAKEVGVEIENRNGRQYGYKLVSAAGSQFLDNLGLKAGDILYEVNGIRLSDASQALGAYEKLKGAPEVWLVIERDGRRETKTFSIK